MHTHMWALNDDR